MGGLVQREVHLQITAAVVDARVALAQVGGIDQLVERDVRGDARDDDGGRQRLAGFGAHPGDPSAGDQNLGHLGPQPKFSAVLCQHVAQMRGERPMPPRSFFICTVLSSGTPSPNASAAALPGVAGPRAAC